MVTQLSAQYNCCAGVVMSSVQHTKLQQAQADFEFVDIVLYTLLYGILHDIYA